MAPRGSARAAEPRQYALDVLGDLRLLDATHQKSGERPARLAVALVDDARPARRGQQGPLAAHHRQAHVARRRRGPELVGALEADLGWIVGWKKESFIRHERLREQKEKGISRKLVGFEMIDRGIARHGYQVMRGDKPIGVVTSGTQTPFVKKAIGMAYVPMDLTAPGSELTIDVRGRTARATVVPLPFYKRTK